MTRDTDVDYERLRKTAERATPHHWKLWGNEVLADPVGDSNYDTALHVAWASDPESDRLRTRNAQHIAAFDPPTVLYLLDEIDRLRSALATGEQDGPEVPERG